MLAPDLLKDKTVFVSGGASLGANVAICGRTEVTLEAAADELRHLGAEVVTAVVDVRDAEAVERAFQSTADVLGPVDSVICGAAGNFMADASKLSSNGYRAVLEIDLLGSFHCASAAFEQLRETRGSLLFVSAGHSTMTFAQQSHVAAAKAGVDQLMRSLALEWGPLGIRSNSIVPGPVQDTEGMKRLTESGKGDAWRQSVPLGRFARGEEIGAMAAVLISPLASFVTGSQVFVDGGLVLSGAGLINAG
jgi:NAD(P)-dependent dehydrogenase (short-subunit alcohol dehydrogenase family)